MYVKNNQLYVIGKNPNYRLVKINDCFSSEEQVEMPFPVEELKKLFLGRKTSILLRNNGTIYGSSAKRLLIGSIPEYKDAEFNRIAIPDNLQVLLLI